MKQFLILGALATSTLGAMISLSEGPRDARWKKVTEAMNKGLPKTAMTELKPIIEAALRDERYGEAAKAVTLNISLEGNIQGNKPEEKIVRLQAAIEKLPKEMKPVMEAVLANWYWHYFQRNRWRFMQRTATAQAPGKDIQSWDLKRILAEIDKHYTIALSADEWLKKTPVSDFSELLAKGTTPDVYRPTMFDFLAHEALTFYSAGEQAGSVAQDAWVLTADSPVFASARDFMNWKIEATDQSAPTLRAVLLWQELLRFHKGDKDPSAFADADLGRLKFGFDHSFGEEKSARYRAALERFSERYARHPLSSLAIFYWAGEVRQLGDLVRAHELARRGWKAFPDSSGGASCFNLIQQIEARQMNVSIERVWNQPWPAITVQYRNLTKVHFRVIRYEWESLLARRDYSPGQGVPASLRNAVLKQAPQYSWSSDLEPTDDFQLRTERLDVSRDMRPGFYFLIASPDGRFTDQDNQVFMGEFWVSTLAIVLRTGQAQWAVNGFVLDADSGAPIAGAQVDGWFYNNRERKWVPTRPVRSDRNGQFVVSSTVGSSYVVRARVGDQRLATARRQAYYSPRRYKPLERTVLFTDRALYRPGQTIRFKGISFLVNAAKDDYHVLPGAPVNLVLRDPNGQQVAEQKFRTNDYGSFSGSFVAPAGGLTGRMMLVDTRRPGSQAAVSVEEYKRPKFQVKLEHPDQPARLNDTVSVTGRATSYTGAPIGAAKVSYRVVREVQYPIWCYWFRPPRQASQEIAHGIVQTAQDGTFRVTFVARPDPSAIEKNEPVFRYSIKADVTDSSGETRWDQRIIHVGYTSMRAALSAGAWQTLNRPVAITIGTNSLNQQPLPAKGKVTLYRLKQPARVPRADLGPGARRYYGPHDMQPTAGDAPPVSPDPKSWPLGEQVAQRPFATNTSGTDTLTFQLSVGVYRALLETEDPFGHTVTAQLQITVIDPSAQQLAIRVPNLVTAERWLYQPGETFTALWGTGYEAGRAFIEIEHRGRLLQQYWTNPRTTQSAVEQSITEAMRGGFTLHVTYVRENRAYLTQRNIQVPWSNKDLTVRWERIVSKLKPSQEVTWTAIIKGPQGRRVKPEMVATLFDASLDAYLMHNWPNMRLFRTDYSQRQTQFENHSVLLPHTIGRWSSRYKDATISYRSLPNEIRQSLWGYQFFQRGRVRRGFLGGGGFGGPSPAGDEMAMDFAEGAAAAPSEMAMAKGAMRADSARFPGSPVAASVSPQPDLSKVAARKNLNETAFFFPHVVAKEDGTVTMSFTAPEALTEWRFIGFAHDSQLRQGLLTGKAVTSKDLMVRPQPPRFVREGDELEFTVKVVNQSAARQQGSVRLSLADARTEESRDQALGNSTIDRSFDIPAKESRSFSWKLKVPDGLDFLTYKAVGSTGRLSDGEEGFLPVLSRRILVTESLPLPVRGPITKTFDFKKLIQSGQSKSLRHQSLTVQMVSQPAWYAVMALPYLMEYPHECSEQTFNRLYANHLARHIGQSDPKIRHVFDQWKGTPALDSPLEKNQEIKSVMLEETPWVRQAQSESAARRNVGILFDANRLDNETTLIMRKLAGMQLPDGSWPWFPGGRGNDYITLYITTGFGRLRHLGTDIDTALAVKALNRLDAWIDRVYREILAHGNKSANHVTPTIALYLYGRSFFLDDQKIAAAHQTAVDYFLDQARKYWLRVANRQSQAHLALALKRFGDIDTARNIMRSIKERSVTDEELGMFWRETERSWWWYRAPIETQAMMIEAFDEVMGDAESVELCRVWLLKQKQTQDWKTSKATADAVYGLLLRGTDLLSSDKLVAVKLGSTTIEPKNVEAGTGFYEQRFVRSEVKSTMGNIQVTKEDAGVAWGSVHWQYLEDMAKVTPYEGTPLKLKKQVYVKKNTAKGPELQLVDGPVAVGDELVVRVELRVDRDMEYVHLKDQRGSGVEPVDVLSGYRYQDGLAYYQSTRDTASHFFIDYLPKGTYVFEYSTRIVHRGRYQTGMAQIQCMYAPEFNSHSESIMLTVQ